MVLQKELQIMDSLPTEPYRSLVQREGIEWVYHIPSHAPASGKIEQFNGLLKTTLKQWIAGPSKFGLHVWHR